MSIPSIQKQPTDAPYRELPAEGQPSSKNGQQTVWIRNNWEGHQQYIVDHIAPQVVETLSVRKLDCIRQVCGSIFCGFVCLPCATVRLTGHVTGCYDPMHVTCCGTERAIPGLELCSAPDCSQICGDPRGYGHKDYTKPQDNGSGWSRRNLDILNCFGAAACALLCVFGAPS